MTRYLVTGAAGFIGSSLVETLLNQGHEVIAFDNLSRGSLQALSFVVGHPYAQNYTFIQGDTRSFSDCLRACEGVQYILHHAALGSVVESMQEGDLYYDNNVVGFQTLLNAAQAAGVKRVVFASSSAVYGDSLVLPKTETMGLMPKSPYAENKVQNEKDAFYYTHEKGLSCIGLRYFNVYGPKQNANSDYSAVIPKFIRRALNHQDLEIYGDGTQSRDFVFIQDIVAANLMASQALAPCWGHPYNIGTGEKTLIKDLARIILDHIDPSLSLHFLPERGGDIKASYSSIQIAREALLFDPKVTLSEGILAILSGLKS